MANRTDWQQFKELLDKHHITKLYHFTDLDNLPSIINNGGMYSWADCERKGIDIPKPGGSGISHSLDSRNNLQDYVRLSFTTQHPMMYVAMKDGRISNPIILEIDIKVINELDTLFSDMNATRAGCHVGGSFADFQMIHFDSVTAQKHFDLDADEQPYYQAEILVKNYVPLKYIINIGNFGIPVPSQPQVIQPKNAYTAQITRNTPTAFIFLIDQSVSMKREVRFNNEYVTMAEAVSRIVNNQINNLVLRCIKLLEVRHYYDIAVIGYGEDAYSGWKGTLAGRDFVSPEELKSNPFKTITVTEQKRTRKGVVEKTVEKTQWMEARCDGSWTHMHKAFRKAQFLIEQWMQDHKGKNCYPPTIINITDGAFNGVSTDEMVQISNELKAMFTNDGNVLLFNIHIVPNENKSLMFPISKEELGNDSYSKTLFDMSSLLPTRYNAPIADLRGDSVDVRHVAMSVNTDMATLIQLMDIGTPTNISQK